MNNEFKAKKVLKIKNENLLKKILKRKIEEKEKFNEIIKENENLKTKGEKWKKK